MDIHERPLRPVAISHDHVPWYALVARSLGKSKGGDGSLLLHAGMGEILLVGDFFNMLRDASLLFGVAKVVLPPDVLDLD